MRTFCCCLLFNSSLVTPAWRSRAFSGDFTLCLFSIYIVGLSVFSFDRHLIRFAYSVTGVCLHCRTSADSRYLLDWPTGQTMRRAMTAVHNKVANKLINQHANVAERKIRFHLWKKYDQTTAPQRHNSFQSNGNTPTAAHHFPYPNFYDLLLDSGAVSNWFVVSWCFEFRELRFFRLCIVFFVWKDDHAVLSTQVFFTEIATTEVEHFQHSRELFFCLFGYHDNLSPST